MSVCVLGCDPGFASFGYGVMELLPDREKVIEVNVIRTKKDTKKKTVLAADDNFRRARAIGAALHSVLEQHQPMAIAAESMSFPRNASVAAKMAMSWGVMASLSEQFGIPVVQASPQRIKKLLCGTSSASKEEMQDALRRRYKGEFFPFQKAIPKGQWEHGFDAVGSVVACLDSDILMMARGAANARRK